MQFAKRTGLAVCACRNFQRDKIAEKRLCSETHRAEMYAFKKPNYNAAREKTRDERKKNYYNQKQFHKDKK